MRDGRIFLHGLTQNCEVFLKASLAIASLSTLLVVISLAGSQTSPSANALAANPVYEKNCAKCHGKTAEGRRFGGPSLANAKAAAATADDLRNIITYGKGHMPRFAGKLNADEIDALVKQIQALDKK